MVPFEMSQSSPIGFTIKWEERERAHTHTHARISHAYFSIQQPVTDVRGEHYLVLYNSNPI
jgi:hypothetical protein